ncbi:unnamed protein product [Parajaminaea phylloscopi]
MGRGGQKGRRYAKAGNKRGGKQNAGRDDRDRNAEQGDGPDLRSQYATSKTMKNDRFEAYYLDQNILTPEEWQPFVDALRAPLPTTFRFTAGKSTTPQLIEQMRNHFVPQLSNIDWEGEKLPSPQALSWYPEGLAWQVDVRKTVLRKQEQFKHFQKFLVNETEVGSISRQEAVSMIPPLFLDVRPEHIVLDMCAAPGSKTAQLIEALHSPITSSPDRYDPCPPGLVVANDSDQKRAYMLVHQAARLPSPNLIVTNLDASAFPKTRVPWKGQDPASEVVTKELKYDRILADVPCSGDGTMRKNPGIWQDWNMNNGMGLHSLQLRILLRGLNALRPGGRLVYSTCSLNPLENEAIVAAALRECGADPANGQAGSVRIVDVADQHPELQRRPGLTTWKVAPGSGRHLFAGSASNQQPKQAPRAAARAQQQQGADESVPESANAEASTSQAEVAASTEEVVPAASSGAEVAVEADGEEAPPTPGSAEYRAALPAIPYVDSWDRLAELDKGLAGRTAKSLWPQGDEAQLGIEKCMRVYPQLQNTGGFFITVLEKVGDVNAESHSAGMLRAIDALDSGAAAPDYLSANALQKKRGRSPGSPAASGDDDEVSAKKPRAEGDDEAVEADEVEVPAPESSAHVKADTHALNRARKAEQQKQQRRNDSGFGVPGGTPYKEDPFCFASKDNDQVQSIAKFFGLSADFPLSNLLVRNKDALPLRSIYLTSSSARALLSGGGPGVALHPSLNPVKLRVLNAGVRAFARQDSNKAGEIDCRWRLISDGLGPVRPFLSEDVVLPAQLSDLAYVLSHFYPFFESLPEGDFKRKIESVKVGSYVMEIRPSKHEEFEVKDTLYMTVWRAATSVNLMLDKADRTAISMRLFGKDLSEAARKQATEMTERRNASLAAADGAATTDGAAQSIQEEQKDVQVTEEQGADERNVDAEVKQEAEVKQQETA